MLRQGFACPLVQFRPNRPDSPFPPHRTRHSLHTKLSFRPQGGTRFFSRAASSLILERSNRLSLVPNPQPANLYLKCVNSATPIFHSPQLNRFSHASPEDSDSGGRLPEIVIPSEAEGPAFSCALRGRTFRVCVGTQVSRQGTAFTGCGKRATSCRFRLAELMFNEPL